ncbi:hypothetical protein CBR_g8024 [Chara braunii]|uniref:Ubiquitin-like protease family profile domain-containing protein n=1 Tax=Chara braunii TaxID=69332 RepID=A0A388KL04_CHABU|nr:hypothetical protein CBR_g8024 [Chara braunii]|eukprot:GBG70725.1 hypothetical protein CBR_g8024 [Chara braunii]
MVHMFNYVLFKSEHRERRKWKDGFFIGYDDIMGKFGLNGLTKEKWEKKKTKLPVERLNNVSKRLGGVDEGKLGDENVGGYKVTTEMHMECPYFLKLFLHEIVGSVNQLKDELQRVSANALHILRDKRKCNTTYLPVCMGPLDGLQPTEDFTRAVKKLSCHLAVLDLGPSKSLDLWTDQRFVELQHLMKVLCGTHWALVIFCGLKSEDSILRSIFRWGDVKVLPSRWRRHHGTQSSSCVPLGNLPLRSRDSMTIVLHDAGNDFKKVMVPSKRDNKLFDTNFEEEMFVRCTQQHIGVDDGDRAVYGAWGREPAKIKELCSWFSKEGEGVLLLGNVQAGLVWYLLWSNCHVVACEGSFTMLEYCSAFIDRLVNSPDSCCHFERPKTQHRPDRDMFLKLGKKRESLWKYLFCNTPDKRTETDYVARKVIALRHLQRYHDAKIGAIEIFLARCENLWFDRKMDRIDAKTYNEALEPEDRFDLMDREEIISEKVNSLFESLFENDYLEYCAALYERKSSPSRGLIKWTMECRDTEHLYDSNILVSCSQPLEENVIHKKNLDGTSGGPSKYSIARKEGLKRRNDEPEEEATCTTSLNDLQKVVLPKGVSAMPGGKVDGSECGRESVKERAERRKEEAATDDVVHSTAQPQGLSQQNAMQTTAAGKDKTAGTQSHGNVAVTREDAQTDDILSAKLRDKTEDTNRSANEETLPLVNCSAMDNNAGPATVCQKAILHDTGRGATHPHMECTGSGSQIATDTMEMEDGGGPDGVCTTAGNEGGHDVSKAEALAMIEQVMGMDEEDGMGKEASCRDESDDKGNHVIDLIEQSGEQGEMSNSEGKTLPSPQPEQMERAFHNCYGGEHNCVHGWTIHLAMDVVYETEEEALRHMSIELNNMKTLATTTNEATGERLLFIVHDFSVLMHENEWLNDNIVNFYMKLILHDNNCIKFHRECDTSFDKSNACGASTVPVTAAYSSYFFAKLLGKNMEYSYERVARWFRDVIIADTELILAPYHDIKRKHWTLLVADRRRHVIEYYDSMDTNIEFAKELTGHFASFIVQRSTQQGRPVDISCFEHNCLVDDIPKQEDAYQCGVFMLTYASLLARGKVSPFHFSMKDIQGIRRRIAIDLIAS